MRGSALTLLLLLSVSSALDLLTFFTVPNGQVMSRVSSDSGSSTFQDLSTNLSRIDVVVGTSSVVLLAQINQNSTTIEAVDRSNAKSQGKLDIHIPLKVLVEGKGTVLGCSDIVTNTTENATTDYFFLFTIDPVALTFSQKEIQVRKSLEFEGISCGAFDLANDMLILAHSSHSVFNFLLYHVEAEFLEFSPNLVFNTSVVDAVYSHQPLDSILAVAHDYRGKDDTPYYFIVLFDYKAFWNMTILYEFSMFDTTTLWDSVNVQASLLVESELYLEMHTFKQQGTLELVTFHCDPKGPKSFTSITMQTPPTFLYQTSDGLVLADPLPPSKEFWAIWKIALLAVAGALLLCVGIYLLWLCRKCCHRSHEETKPLIKGH